MKTFLLIGIYFLTMFYHCGDDGDSYYTHRMKIDSIAYQRSVLLADTIAIKFYGQIGTRSNEFFDRVEIENTLDTVRFNVLMRDVGGLSYAKSTYLNGEIRNIKSQKLGILRLIVLQPTGVKELSDSVIVK